MKKLLLGITLLVIIFVAVLCKPIDNLEDETLMSSEKVEPTNQMKSELFIRK